MSEFKLCKNGHYYQSHLEECPYCPSGTGNTSKSDMEKTRIDTGDGGDKTRIDTGFGGDKTQIFGGNTGGGNLNKTQIFTGDPASSSGNFTNQLRNTGRKLVGWLVSFTIDANGVDYRLYEGRNSVGSDPGCDIVVPNDQAVSGKHLTILNRVGAFKFKDELSTNGTFINEQFEEEGTLKDGDNIRIGNTVFKFRSVS